MPDIQITYSSFMKLYIIRWGDMNHPNIKVTTNKDDIPTIIGCILGVTP